MVDGSLETLKRLAFDEPRRAAFQCNWGEVSYGLLYDEVVRRAKHFTREGVRPCDRASVRVSNRPDDLVSLLALRWHEVPALLIDRSATDVECERAERLFAPTLHLDGARLTRVGDGDIRVESGPSICLVTSGVTGRPKLVDVDWDLLEGTAHRFSVHYGLCPRDVVLCTTPISHSYGLCVGVVGPLCCGATIALMERRSTAGGLAAAIRQHRASIVQSVPFYYRLLAAAPNVDLSPVRLCLSAGEAPSVALMRHWFERSYPLLCNHYGATEVGQISVELDGIEGSVGRPIAGCEVDVRKPEPSRSAIDADSCDDGEIWARAAGKPSRYVGIMSEQDPSRNNGWFRTGDIGRLDASGRLRITGRVVNRINVGGRKVDPREIEEVIRLFPGVTDCAVVGRQSEEAGEEVHAYVQGDVSRNEDLLRFLRERLSEFKLPRVVRRVEQIPRTISGKIRYGVLDDASVR